MREEEEREGVPLPPVVAARAGGGGVGAGGGWKGEWRLSPGEEGQEVRGEARAPERLRRCLREGQAVGGSEVSVGVAQPDKLLGVHKREPYTEDPWPAARDDVSSSWLLNRLRRA